MKEQYGDRQTISRYAKYVIRSFVAWGVLFDTDTKGCYAKRSALQVDEPDISVLIDESALHAEQEPKIVFSLIQANPAFFPFEVKSLSSARITQLNNRIDVARYGMDNELLVLTEMKAHERKASISNSSSQR